MHTAPGVENITHEVYKGFSRIICPMRVPAKPMIMMEKASRIRVAVYFADIKQ